MAITALLATLPRTVNTGVSTVLDPAALLVLGVDSLPTSRGRLLLGIVLSTCLLDDRRRRRGLT